MINYDVMKTKISLLAAVVLQTVFLFGQDTFLWRIENPKSNHVSYLNGTNHTLNSNYVDDFPIIKDKLKNADIVVFEVNLDDKKAIDDYYNSLPENKETIELFTTEQKQKLVNKFGSIILKFSPKEIYGRLLFEMKKNNSGKEGTVEHEEVQNIEKYLKKLSLDESKEIIYLESVAVQLQTSENLKFGAIINGLFKKTLPKMVDDMDNPEKNYILSKKQNDNTEKFKTQKTAYDFNFKCNGRFHEVLLVNRNNEWMKKLSYVLDNQNAFISVGFNHLQYRCGLVKQLLEKGYKLTPVDMKTGKDLPFAIKYSHHFFRLYPFIKLFSCQKSKVNRFFL